jgi:hypothetical protein
MVVLIKAPSLQLRGDEIGIGVRHMGRGTRIPQLDEARLSGRGYTDSR